MHTTPMPPHPNPQPTPEENTQFHRALLRELLETGIETVRIVHAETRRHVQAAAQNPAAPPIPDPTLPFDRIARAIRRTIAQAQRLDAPPPPPPRPAPSPSTTRTARRTPARARPDQDPLEHLTDDELDELDPETIDFLTHRPVPARPRTPRHSTDRPRIAQLRDDARRLATPTPFTPLRRPAAAPTPPVRTPNHHPANPGAG